MKNVDPTQLLERLEPELIDALQTSNLIALATSGSWSGVSILLSCLYVENEDEIEEFFQPPERVRAMADLVYPKQWRGKLTARTVFSMEPAKGILDRFSSTDEAARLGQVMAAQLGRPLSPSELEELKDAEIAIDAVDSHEAIAILRDAAQIAMSDGRKLAGIADVVAALGQNQDFVKQLFDKHRIVIRLVK